MFVGCSFRRKIGNCISLFSDNFSIRIRAAFRADVPMKVCIVFFAASWANEWNLVVHISKIANPTTIPIIDAKRSFQDGTPYLISTISFDAAMSEARRNAPSKGIHPLHAWVSNMHST